MISNPNAVNDDWIEKVMNRARSFDSFYWKDFVPAKEAEIDVAETLINRELPLDFRRFLMDAGSGRFGVDYGGNIYSPSEIVEACAGPIWMVHGTYSLMTPEQHIRFYATRGEDNPAPNTLRVADMTIDGINPFDLIQIGTDGCGNYHQLHVGATYSSFSYCLLCPEGVCESRLASFREFIEELVETHAEEALS